MTKVDFAWSFTFLFIMLASFIGCMSVAIFYLIPVSLDYPNVLPRAGNDRLIEFIIVITSLAIGLVLPVLIFCYISRRYVDITTYNRWVLQLENGKQKLPKLYRKLGSYLVKQMKPNDAENSL